MTTHYPKGIAKETMAWSPPPPATTSNNPARAPPPPPPFPPLPLPKYPLIPPGWYAALQRQEQVKAEVKRKEATAKRKKKVREALQQTHIPQEEDLQK